MFVNVVKTWFLLNKSYGNAIIENNMTTNCQQKDFMKERFFRDLILLQSKFLNLRIIGVEIHILKMSLNMT